MGYLKFKFQSPGYCLLLLCALLFFSRPGLAEEPGIADFEKPFYGLKRQGTTASPKAVPLIVVGWQPRGKNEPTLTKAGLQNLFFGPTDSVAHWFKENSVGRYELTPHPTHPVLGPYQSKYDWPFYWRNSPEYVRKGLCGDPNTFCQAWNDNPYKVPPAAGDPHRYVRPSDKKVFYLDDEGFIAGHTHSWAEAVRAADQQIDFRKYDKDGDHNLSTDEALVVIVKAQASNFGTRRPVRGSNVPDKDLVVDGVSIKVVCEVYAGPPHGSDDLAVAIEEVLHLAANLADQYPDSTYRHADDPGRPGQLALTDAGGRPVHIDPYHKLKWGWLNLQAADHSGRYTLRDTASTGDALILFNPFMGTDEFFILENRWRGKGYDRFRSNNRGDGLALWHCIQDSGLNHNWARRAVHLRRVDPRLDAAGNIRWNMTLYDGDDPLRNGNLGDDTTPQNLLFRSGIPSRMEIKNISGAGSVMTFDVVRAPKINSVHADTSKVKFVRVHAKNTGFGPPEHRLTEDGIVRLASKPHLADGVDLNRAPGRIMLKMLLDAYESNGTVRLEYIVKTAVGNSTVRVILQK